MKIFITGSTGYIGNAVAKEFVKAGNDVFGLARDPAKFGRLIQSGIKPVPGNMDEPNTYRNAAAQADVVVHAALSGSDGSGVLDHLTVKTLLDIGKAERKHKPLLLYTSGTWVYGDTGQNSEADILGRNPLAVVKDRPDVEDMVLEAGGIVLRPGVVYGQGGGITGQWIRSIVAGEEILVAGDGTNHWSMVHVEDLAAGYRLAAEKGFRGRAFDFVDEESLSILDITNLIIDAIGIGFVRHLSMNEAKERWDVMAEALAVHQTIDASMAREQLNWRPRIPSFYQDPYLKDIRLPVGGAV